LCFNGILFNGTLNNFNGILFNGTLNNIPLKHKMQINVVVKWLAFMLYIQYILRSNLDSKSR
jgi:hypothetical protein